MTRRTPTALALLVAAAALAACGDAATTDSAARKSDVPAWRGADNPYVTEGWKAGDEASWQQQMRARVQAQNEYARASGS
ncbi:MAG: hypothetical protein ACLGIT_09225 [Gammaproteobacteria bacterium]|uniref:hypothetical protein n=1 Tax=Azohydromonas sp. TaxID=1872666 RepID=UPI002C16D8BA|nr:hypothetical protein [Azohydromonas sp.]HMM84229.1 hypothetical protein [Azohydromonas sp.]